MSFSALLSDNCQGRGTGCKDCASDRIKTAICAGSGKTTKHMKLNMELSKCYRFPRLLRDPVSNNLRINDFDDFLYGLGVFIILLRFFIYQ